MKRKLTTDEDNTRAYMRRSGSTHRMTQDVCCIFLVLLVFFFLLHNTQMIEERKIHGRGGEERCREEEEEERRRREREIPRDFIGRQKVEREREREREREGSLSHQYTTHHTTGDNSNKTICSLFFFFFACGVVARWSSRWVCLFFLSSSSSSSSPTTIISTSSLSLKQQNQFIPAAERRICRCVSRFISHSMFEWCETTLSGGGGLSNRDHPNGTIPSENTMVSGWNKGERVRRGKREEEWKMCIFSLTITTTTTTNKQPDLRSFSPSSHHPFCSAWCLSQLFCTKKGWFLLLLLLFSCSHHRLSVRVMFGECGERITPDHRVVAYKCTGFVLSFFLLPLFVFVHLLLFLPSLTAALVLVTSRKNFSLSLSPSLSLASSLSVRLSALSPEVCVVLCCVVLCLWYGGSLSHTRKDAQLLLRRVSGRKRGGRERENMTQEEEEKLCELCGYLPLAIRFVSSSLSLSVCVCVCVCAVLFVSLTITVM